MNRILLIEDNIELAENFALLLRDKNFSVRCAYSGLEGLSIYSGEKFDIILCDIMLPDLNGYKLLAELKKNKKTAVPIFIFITAKTQRQDMRTGMELGADDYLTKPFTFQELYNAIKIQITKRNSLEPVGKKDDLNIQKFDKVGNGKLKYDDYFFFDYKKNPGFQLIGSIVMIKSMKDYSHIIFQENKKIIMRKSMKYWESKLPADKFIRVHRQTIVNLDFIEKIEPRTSNRFCIKLKTQHNEIIISQRFSKKLKEIFGQKSLVA